MLAALDNEETRLQLAKRAQQPIAFVSGSENEGLGSEGDDAGALLGRIQQLSHLAASTYGDAVPKLQSSRMYAVS